MKKKGFVINKSHGWWELTEKGKNPTKYGIFLKEDSIRGHAYIWVIEIEKIPANWDNRIEILKQKGINFKLVGAKETTPRIKVLGRKVWLCNKHLRIFDTEKSSYYGENATESQNNARLQAMRIIHALENKLGLKLNPERIKFKKEHYALIKNSLAKEYNKQGVILRVRDENDEEWLLVDDSLEQGGELETVGKKSFKTNPKVQNWYNDHKKHNFQVTPTFLMNALSSITQNQMMHSQNIIKHQKVLDEMLITLKAIQKSLTKK
jgi:hypothetical protein